jgi:gamma-glutamyltranspeptidase / glutathione hydrolase
MSKVQTAGGQLGFRNAPARGPAVAANAMVATSQPTATLAGLDILKTGGNAVDAAIAAAAVLCVAEPMSTGIGGDVFAIVADRDGVHGLDAAGPAPASAAPAPIDRYGPRSVVVPGAVGGWAALSERFGRLGLDTVLMPAIGYASAGVAAGPNCAAYWEHAASTPFGPPPEVGQRFALPDLSATLSRIAESGPDAFYQGDVARAICAVSWLEHDDLASFRPLWVDPLTRTYRGVDVLELPAPTQGVAVLEALGLLELIGEPTMPNQILAVSAALADAFQTVRDGADVEFLLSDEYLRRRIRDRPRLAPELPGGTVYLCCVDGDGLAVSFIQSLFENFGSGVVAPDTGVLLNNRAAGFFLEGQIIGGRRPYHTIIPGMLMRGPEVIGPFGVMGGYIQAQAHLQLVCGLVDDNLDPQAALDRGRFRVGGTSVALEESLWERAAEVKALGFDVTLDPTRAEFGGGQAIVLGPDRLLGGSDPRKDGFAAGF